MVRLHVYELTSYYALKNLNLEYVIRQRSNITRKGLVDLNFKFRVGESKSLDGCALYLQQVSVLVCQLDFLDFH